MCKLTSPEPSARLILEATDLWTPTIASGPGGCRWAEPPGAKVFEFLRGV